MNAAAVAAALLDPRSPAPAGLRSWNGSDAAARLAVHRNNVIVSLVDALADSFPVVQALVGEDFFRAMAAVFVRRCPPTSPVLALYGQALPEFIAGFGPADALPYLADVARLEHLRLQACHAADALPLPADALASQVAAALGRPRQLAGLRLQLHPSVRVLQAGHAAVSLWAAHQADGALAGVDTEVPESALVLRDGDEVLVLRLPPGAATFITALQRGCPLGDAAALAGLQAADFDLGAALGLLMQQPALTALIPDEESPA